MSDLLTKHIVLLLALLVSTSWGQTLSPQESDALFKNPGKGWTFYYWDHGMRDNYNARLKGPDDHLEDIPGLGVVYLRFAWSYLEPVEGGFRWDLLDQVIDDRYAHGHQSALRITCVTSIARLTYGETGYATPKWVRDAGAQGYDYKDQGGKPMWEPIYGDPVFLAKLNNFLKAFGERYNGSKKIAWIDLGSLGTWGEGHIGFASGKNQYDTATGKLHIDKHVKYFPNTTLLINDDHPEALKEYARQKGFGIRDDSAKPAPGPGDGRPKDDVAQFWESTCAVCETYHYEAMKGQFKYSIDQIEQTIRDYVNNNHSSHVSIHGWPREFRDDVGTAYMEEVARKMGYRFVIKEVTVPGPIVPGTTLDITFGVENKGVAPCYEGYRLALALTGRDGDPGACLLVHRSCFNINSRSGLSIRPVPLWTDWYRLPTREDKQTATACWVVWKSTRQRCGPTQSEGLGSASLRRSPAMKPKSNRVG